MKRAYLAVAAVAAIGLLAFPGVALADVGSQIDKLKGGLADTDIALNTTWVLVAAILVMFMQAGFLLLEVGFSRMKNAGAGVAKVLVNFSVASLAYWAVGFALAFGGAACDRRRRTGSSSISGRRRSRGDTDPVPRGLPDQSGGVPVLPVRLLCGLAGDRLGHNAGADQVQRLPDLRGGLQRRALPDHQPLDLRWRLAAGEPRDAGLRRIDGGPPDGCDRRAGGTAAARPAAREVRRRRQAAGDPRTLDAARRPRDPDPLAGLVRVQPRLDAGRVR